MITLAIGDQSSALDELLARMARNGTEHIFYSQPLSALEELDTRRLSSFSTILLYPGDEFPSLSEQVQISLVDYVEAGGLLLAFPFSAWSARFRGNSALGRILPVACQGGFFEHEPISWSLGDVFWGSHVRADARFRENTVRVSGEHLVPQGDSAFSFESCKDGHKNPLVVGKGHGNGFVVYFNFNHHEVDSTRTFWSEEDVFDPYYPMFSVFWQVYTQILWRHFRSRFCTAATDFIRRNADSFYWRWLALSGRKRPSAAIETVDVEVFKNMPDPSMHGFLRRESYPECLFPHDRDWASLTFTERNLVCRSILSMPNLLSLVQDDADWDRVFRSEKKPVTFSSQERGHYFERFCRYFFELVPAFTVVEHSLKSPSMEVDLVLRNRSSDGFLSALGPHVFVECKNWRNPVGAKEIRDFGGKLDEANIQAGIIVSGSAFSGDAGGGALDAIKVARQKGKTILPLGLKELYDSLMVVSPETVFERSYRATLQ